MNVRENVGYSLKIKKVSRNDQERLIEEILQKVKLEGYDSRKPSELSGGQRQRVALDRYLINKHKVLLLVLINLYYRKFCYVLYALWSVYPNNGKLSGPKSN